MTSTIPGFSWSHARVFLAVAEVGSFSAAARRLQSTQPTVGRQVAALEAELGLALFERVGNGLVLTPAGAELAAYARTMDDAAQNLARVAAGRSEALAGVVRVSASELIAAYVLGPFVRRLRHEHPAIELELVVSNTVHDLQRREADLAVRNFAPAEPELVFRKLPVRAAHMYATPGLLASLRRDGPLQIEDLARAEFFGFAEVERMVTWLRANGIPATRANFPIVTDNHLVQWQLCKAGLGICFVMAEVGDAEPTVQRVLAAPPPMPVPMYVVSHRDLRTSRRMRVVFDLLVEVLG